MTTTKIKVDNHLAEYAIGKWGTEFHEPVRFPDISDLYYSIYDLTQKRPIDSQTDKGNLEIVLPSCTKDGDTIRKNPEIYNFLSERSCRIINRKLTNMFWAEIHEYIDHQKHKHGIEFIESVYSFMCRYRITSITEDALLKNYQRWKQVIRQRKKRQYNKTK